MNLKEIAIAWKNVVLKPEEIQEIVEERREICNGCPHKTKMLKIEVCGKCHCPILSKTNSPLNSCPLKKWVR